MRTKPNRKALEKVAGKRGNRGKYNPTSAVIRHVLESESTLLKRGLASDFGRIKKEVEKRPETLLVPPVRRKTFEQSVSPSSSSNEGIVPFRGEGNRLSFSEPEYQLSEGAGRRLPRKGRGQGVLERGNVQLERDAARRQARGFG